jgi:hypothetical protein
MLLGAARRWLTTISAWRPHIAAVSWSPSSPIITNRYSAAWPLSPLAAKHAGKVGEVNWNYRGFNSFRRALD